jgi:hypothetical protein
MSVFFNCVSNQPVVARFPWIPSSVRKGFTNAKQPNTPRRKEYLEIFSMLSSAGREGSEGRLPALRRAAATGADAAFLNRDATRVHRQCQCPARSSTFWMAPIDHAPRVNLHAVARSKRYEKRAGYALAQRIRKFKPAARLICMSSYSGQALPAGALFLAKPFSVAAVQDCIDRALGGVPAQP